MANKVFANGMEVSCKAASGKSICAFPDVCYTPPQTPAAPPGIPIPYPNTGLASDTTDGSTTVQISGQEVGLKDKSYFKRSTGDEAGCAPQKGVINSTVSGKVYFVQWSMDVMFEGENATRHLDLTTHNHGSNPNEAAPWPYIDTMAMPDDHPCKESVQREQTACNPNNTPPGSAARADGRGMDCTPACAAARACALPKKKDDKKVCCSPNTTGDHLVEVNSFTQSGSRGGLDIGSIQSLEDAGITLVSPNRPAEGPIEGDSIQLAAPKSRPRRLSGFDDYDDEQAPTACVLPPGPGTNHNRMQAYRDRVKRQCKFDHKKIPLEIFPTGEESHWTYDQAAQAGVASHQKENPTCNPECTRMQLDAYHHSILPGDTAAAKNACPVRTHIPRR